MDLQSEELEVIGYRRDGRPIYLIQGGAPEESEEENEEESEEEGEEEDEEEGEEESPDDKKKPPAKKAPAKAAPKSGYDSALSRERAARKTAERQLRELRKKNESDSDRLAREADEYAAAKYKPGAVRAAARAGLAEAKIKGDAARAVRLLALDDLDVDDDGEISGLDEQIATLKADYPELFEQPAKRRPIVKADGAGKKAPTTEPKTSAEKIAAMYGQ